MYISYSVGVWIGCWGLFDMRGMVVDLVLYDYLWIMLSLIFFVWNGL